MAQNDFDVELEDQLPPDLRKEIDSLRAHEARVLEALKNPKMHALFVSDPGRALAEMKIPMSPLLKARLRGGAGAQNVLAPRSFRLPNGQVVTPKVNIRLTGRK